MLNLTYYRLQVYERGEGRNSESEDDQQTEFDQTLLFDLGDEVPIPRADLQAELKVCRCLCARHERHLVNKLFSAFSPLVTSAIANNKSKLSLVSESSRSRRCDKS